MRNCLETDDNAELLKRVISGELTRIYGYDTEIKAQSYQSKFFVKPIPHVASVQMWKFF